MTETTNVVLVGAGHAHLHVAAHAQRLIEHGAHVTLISPGDFWYSGMATGMLGGDYEASQDRLDPASLIEAHGGEFVADRVIGIDRHQRLVRLADSPPLAYDLLSLNLGSRVDPSSIFGLSSADNVWPVKPLSGLWRLRQQLESALAGDAEAPSLAVIGGGPTGVELTANLVALYARYGREPNIALVSASERLLPNAPRAAGAWIERRLERCGVRLELAASAVGHQAGELRLDDGMRLNVEHVVLANGLIAPELTGELGLCCDSRQGLAITAALHSPDDSRIFAVGDCAWLRQAPYPKLGVFGVRQAPVLLDNLCAWLAGEALRDYRPQRRYLSVLNLGDGRGLALWDRWWWKGRLALKLKRRLDRRFMAQYGV
ncbi:FAD-dependent oxidoreductase [Halomonas sp. HP20-15]|uniref:FAD-dependent oxidoreductase n=1 Tax=Halomonas sp. HP20-15 TaxID=3085901 RepID=UPI002981AB22|nr:FAD-dependent oxidoreductase [Halomonas sp. HP20-15]MDW5377077.1 FAD-dependent oxidoreductase [Halomonas sp. HP20-15]